MINSGTRGWAVERYVDLTRAARLAGVSRDEIQSRVNAGELTSHEGQVALRDLEALFPEISDSNNRMLAFVEQLKDDALLKATPSTGRAVSVNELRAEMRALETELSHFKHLAATRLTHLQDTDRMLETLERRVEPMFHVTTVRKWLQGKLRSG